MLGIATPLSTMMVYCAVGGLLNLIMLLPAAKSHHKKLLIVDASLSVYIQLYHLVSIQ